MSPRVERAGGLTSSPDAPQLKEGVYCKKFRIDLTLAVFQFDIFPLKDDAFAKQACMYKTFPVFHEKSDPTPGASPLLKREVLIIYVGNILFISVTFCVFHPDIFPLNTGEFENISDIDVTPETSH